MATYPKLAQAYITMAGDTLYTGAAGGSVIRQIRVVSVGDEPGDASSDHFRMAHGSDYEDDCIYPWTLVAADGMEEDDCFLGVPNGDDILVQSFASDVALVITLYGYEL